MITLTPRRRIHVSNRAAVFAALILVMTSFTGLTSSSDDGQHYQEDSNAAIAQSNDHNATETSIKPARKISLLMIGRG
jgi:hypothetical protein